MVVRNLWVGADVRWCGPETVRKGIRLHPGDRATVLDVGRHQATSIGALSAMIAKRPPRPARDVTIRAADGAQLTVPHDHLELVAPEHPLVPESDATHADWWLEQLDPWQRTDIPVSWLVPSSFPSVCQVLHRWQAPNGELIRWRTLDEHPGIAELRDRLQTREGLVPALAHEQHFEALTGQLDEDTADALVAALGHATTTPDDVFVAVWEGWGGIPAQRFPGAARVDTDNRGHFLLRGPLTGVLRSVSASSHGQPVSGLWWPADRAWFVATEIDHKWTFVAGQPSLIEQLLEDPQLEVSSTTFDALAGHAPKIG